MAIAPIDLQTMYSQMNNVAKTVSHQQQGAQLTQQLEEAKVIQQNMEKATVVKKAADNEAKALSVDSNSNPKNSYQNPKKKDGKNKEGEVKPKQDEYRESYLGQHIDITS